MNMKPILTVRPVYVLTPFVYINNTLTYLTNV